MREPPKKADVLALKGEVKSFLRDLRHAERRTPVQPRLKDVLAAARKTFKVRRIDALVEVTGVSTTTLKKIESGRAPNLETVFVFLMTLEKTCDAFAGPAGTSLEQEGWVKVPPAGRNASLQLQGLLAGVLDLAQGSNEQSLQGAVLTPLERAELVAILETALLHLKAPLVNKPFLARLKAMAARIGEKAAEKQLELALGSAAAAAAAALGTFLSSHLK